MPASRLVAGLAALALALAASPWGIMAATGRTDLTFRVQLVSWVVVAGLVLLGGAILAGRGTARKAMFAGLLAWLPLAGLVGLEAAAIVLRLADRVAPLEDLASLQRGGNWPGHLMSNSRFRVVDGLRLYTPWSGDGVTHNSLGLRGAEPQPKRPGEWRIALTGGSTVWGWRVGDDDTIPAILQRLYRDAGRGEVRVYNFGIEGARLQSELALVERFHARHGLDEVVFYTGGNNVIDDHLARLKNAAGPVPPWMARLRELELAKLFARLTASADPAVAERLLAGWTPDLPRAAAEALERCRGLGLRCTVMLQPALVHKTPLVAPEPALLETTLRFFPGLDRAFTAEYDATLKAVPDAVDLRPAVQGVDRPIFVDSLHINEPGNAILARAIHQALTQAETPRQ